MVRLRIKYEKRGPIRFTSHRDLLRIFRRCFAAGEIPVRYSQGFNPHPRFSFGPSLRTGWEGLDEYMDVFLESPLDDAAARCNAHLPDGFRVIETARVTESVPKLSADVKAARYDVVLDAVVWPEVKTFFVERGSGYESRDRSPVDGSSGARGIEGAECAGEADGADGRGDLAGALESALRRRRSLESPRRAVEPDDRNAPLPVVLDVAVWDNSALRDETEDPGIHIEYTSTMDGGRNVSPEELITPVLGDTARLSIPMRVTRTCLLVKRQGEYYSPIDRAVVEKRV